VKSSKIQKAQALIKKKPYLIWHTRNFQNLSKESIFEAVINYGDWKDFLELQELFGIKTSHLLFKKVAGKKRSNIKPETRNYFEKYFAKYA